MVGCIQEIKLLALIFELNPIDCKKWFAFVVWIGKHKIHIVFALLTFYGRTKRCHASIGYGSLTD